MDAHMENKTFDYNGSVISIKVSFRSMYRYQERFGDTFISSFQEFENKKTDMVLLQRLFWSCLCGDYTLDDATDMIEALGVFPAIKLLLEAVSLAFPDAGEEPKSGKGKAGL